MVGKKGMKSYERTPEIRERMRLAKLGKKHTAEHNANIATSLLGNQRRKGIPTPMAMRLHLQSTSRKQTLEERFWSKVEKTDGCWLWTGSLWTNGYGMFLVGSRIDNSRQQVLAHRLAYELTIGPIPAGMLVCHHCDTPRCVRPDHLFLGTHKENTADSIRKGRYRLPPVNDYVPPAMPGSANPSAKLTEEQVQNIRQRRADGIPVKQLVRDFGVSKSTIYYVIAGTTWSHVKNLNPPL